CLHAHRPAPEPSRCRGFATEPHRHRVIPARAACGAPNCFIKKERDMKNTKRLLASLFTATTLAVAGFTGAVSAATWPEKPVRILVGFAPGGPTDVVARILSGQLSKELGQPVII